MKRDEVLADAAFGSVALGMLYSSTLSNLPLYQIVAFAIGSAIVLTAFRHWVVEMPFSLAILTNLGLWAVFLSGLPPTSYMLAVVLVLVVSFALTPSFKALGRLQRALLEGEEAKLQSGYTRQLGTAVEFRRWQISFRRSTGPNLASSSR